MTVEKPVLIIQKADPTELRRRAKMVRRSAKRMVDIAREMEEQADRDEKEVDEAR